MGVQQAIAAVAGTGAFRVFLKGRQTPADVVRHEGEVYCFKYADEKSFGTLWGTVGRHVPGVPERSEHEDARAAGRGVGHGGREDDDKGAGGGGVRLRAMDHHAKALRLSKARQES
jgi:hypothetical protein